MRIERRGRGRKILLPVSIDLVDTDLFFLSSSSGTETRCNSLCVDILTLLLRLGLARDNAEEKGEECTPSLAIAVALRCLTESDDAPLRAAAATLAAAAAAAGARPSSSSPTLSSRVAAAQKALLEFASDDPHAGVRRAAMAALVEEVSATVEDEDVGEEEEQDGEIKLARRRRRRQRGENSRSPPSLALGRLRPELASAVARAALSGDCDASVRLQSLRLLLAACREAGACRGTSRAAPSSSSSLSSPASAAAAADIAFASASRAAAADPDARVRAASLALLGRLGAASPETLGASLTKATTARTMEGYSADDASLIAQEGVGGAGMDGGGAGGGGGGMAGGNGGKGGGAAAGSSAEAASAAAAAANPSSPWEAAPGAFVHGLEDDAAAVRECALEALASLSRSLGGAAAVRGKGGSLPSRSFLARAAAFAAGCSGDEAPAVRATALRCLRAATTTACLSLSTPLDEHLPAVLSGLRDSAPEVAAAAATGLLTPEPGAPCPLRGAAALRTVVSMLLEAACGGTPASSSSFSSASDGSAARAAARAALAALGFAAGARAAPLVAELAPGKGGGGGGSGGNSSKNGSNAFVQREPSVDDQAYASRLIFLLAASRASPSVASLLPRHALDAAGVLSARHAGLPLPGGGLRWLGRGAVAVVGGGGRGGRRRGAGKKRARSSVEEDGARETARAVAASLEGAAGAPAEARARALRLAEAALSPLARCGGGGGSGTAAAARIAVRALAVISALRDKGEEGGGGEGGGEEDEDEDQEVEEEVEEEELGGCWDGGALDPPPLSECLGAAPSRSLARRRLERLADVLELGFIGVGGSGKESGSSPRWKQRHAAFAAEVRVVAAVAARRDGTLSSAVADAEAAASAAGLAPAAWIALARSDPAVALQRAWPVLSLSSSEDDDRGDDDESTCSAVGGELLSPGGPHSLPVEGVSSLPLPLAVVAKVSSCPSSFSSSESSLFDKERPLWLRVSSPGAEVMMLRLRGGGGGGGGGNDPAAAVAAAALAAATSSSADANAAATVVFSSRVELPHPPSPRDCTLTLALVARLGWRKRKRTGDGAAALARVPVFARLGAARALRLRVVRQQQQQPR